MRSVWRLQYRITGKILRINYQGERNMAWESRVQKKNSWNAPPAEKSIFPKKRGWSNPDTAEERPPVIGITKGHGFNLLNLKTYPDKPSAVQPKLTVGTPGDKYEQEADAMASQVMAMPDSAVQRETAPEKQTEEEVQAKPLAAGITPLVQREAVTEEEEIQTKPLSNATIQREVMPEEEELQTKPISASIQRENLPEEQEEVQTKPELQRATDSSFQAGSGVESQLSSSKGGGSPLSDEVRGFMEPRFGADFSSVRVHTGNEAVQMSKELGAQAFTHGSDVYFGVGKSPENNELMAHELTHVVQQGGEQGQINKKSIFPGQTCTEKDWYIQDMMLWRNEIGNLSKTKNTFVRSAIYNTKNNFSDEYESILERSSYYNVIDALGQEEIIPKKVRFFGATAKVTDIFGVGSIERKNLIGWGIHSEEAIQILKEINKILFESNMKVIKKLMNSSGKPTDPRDTNSTEAISAMKFDLNMVEMEQGIVQSYLKEKTGKISAQAIKDINDDLNFKGFWRTLGQYTAVNTQPIEWAKKSLGKDKLDFMQIDDRVAIGKALVFSLHSNTLDEYLLYMKNRVVPVDSLQENYRTKGVLPLPTRVD